MLEHTMSLTVDGVVDIEGYVDYGPDHLVTVTMEAYWRHFSTTFDANLCWEKSRRLAWTSLIEHGAIGIPSMLHNELNYVVAVAILYKVRAALAEFLQNDLLLLVGTVLEDALHHAAAVRVGGAPSHGP